MNSKIIQEKNNHSQEQALCPVRTLLVHSTSSHNLQRLQDQKKNPSENQTHIFSGSLANSYLMYVETKN